MPLRHVAPGKLLDACRFWYPEPLRTRKLLLAACGYRRFREMEVPESRIAREWEEVERVAAGKPPDRPFAVLADQLRSRPDQFAYGMLWQFGPPNIPGGRNCEELNAVTLCVFGGLTEDESKRSPEVLRFDPTWRTEAVVGIATKVDEDRAFEAMPILADALEEAGCDNRPMLSHCREAAIHTCGCWVLDHILGKS